MAVKLPQNKALNVRLGLALLVVGLLIVFYSWSGDQAYDIAFFYFAVLGSVLAVAGSVLLAHSRVLTERRRGLQAQAKSAVREWVRLECPSCGTRFDVEGERPFTAICPECKRSGLIA